MAVEQTRIVNGDAPNLTVLFPPWRGGHQAYDLLTRRLVRSGSAVLRYWFSPQILEPNVARVLESFEHIRRTVTADLEELTQDNRYQRVSLTASSLGNVSLGLVAKSFAGFHDATFVVAGSNLARSVWEGSRTQSIRLSLEDQGVDIESLDKAWAEIAPKDAASSFGGKSARFVTSTTDGIIPAAYQTEMAQAVRPYANETRVEPHRTGHVSTVALYCASHGAINL